MKELFVLHDMDREDNPQEGTSQRDEVGKSIRTLTDIAHTAQMDGRPELAKQIKAKLTDWAFSEEENSTSTQA